MRRRSTTGPASMSAAMSAALLQRQQFQQRARHRQQRQRPSPRRSAGRRGLAVRSELRGRHRRPVQLAVRQCRRGLPRRLCLHQQPARARLDHRPRRLHLGSGPALCEGRLRLFRQQRDRDARRRADCLRHLGQSLAAATPSAPASNTCSRRTGRPRPSTSTTISAMPISPRRSRWCRPAPSPPTITSSRLGVNYRFNWARPGDRALLTRPRAGETNR